MNTTNAICTNPVKHNTDAQKKRKITKTEEAPYIQTNYEPTKKRKKMKKISPNDHRRQKKNTKGKHLQLYHKRTKKLEDRGLPI